MPSRERWSRLLAQEQVVEEIVREFQNDVAIPEVLRDYVLLIRSKLERLYEGAPQFVGDSNGARRTRRPSTSSTADRTAERPVDTHSGVS